MFVCLFVWLVGFVCLFVCLFVSLFVWGLSSNSIIFNSYGDVTITNYESAIMGSLACNTYGYLRALFNLYAHIVPVIRLNISKKNNSLLKHPANTPIRLNFRDGSTVGLNITPASKSFGVRIPVTRDLSR